MQKKSWGLFIIFLFSSAFFISSCGTKKINYSYNYEISDEDQYYLDSEAKKLHIKIPNKRDIRKFLYYFTHEDRGFIQEGLNNAQIYLPTVKKIFIKYNIPTDLAYLPLIESKYNPYAVSSSGAAGLWQFLPMTAKRFGLKINHVIDERKDPYKSSIAAAKYLKYLYSLFGRWDLVLAAYNCGEGCIQRKKGYKKGFWNIKYKLPKQTRDYVPKFFAALLIAKNPRKYGFYIKRKPVYIVRKPAKTTFSLKKLAYFYHLDYNLVKLFNAHLKRKVAYKGVYVNIPIKKKIASKKPKIKKVSLKYKIYIVKPKDTLYRIAKKYDISIEKIKRVNKLHSNIIKVGQVLKIPIED
ncbi:lytic transglycosylase domain-containing protein [Hydrogenothermus marinus]|uniref:Membrane-bound lytic murein transglycosylase D n=1 Tax=Hydrogenothermus marinus TaxID=133270 RepID=A0A3M0B8T8_9AQUI|nr:lytic transglycosylase domain-containing protein [Hydrogenothermus marinus]RMA92549.1 membrane-bound lytic murein transglycosylase D [Hydrogenothermus marinus]